jgi:hypothetical protein
VFPAKWDAGPAWDYSVIVDHSKKVLMHSFSGVLLLGLSIDFVILF